MVGFENCGFYEKAFFIGSPGEFPCSCYKIRSLMLSNPEVAQDIFFLVVTANRTDVRKLLEKTG